MIIEQAKVELEKHLTELKVDEGHGINHALIVYEHARKALEAEDYKLTEDEKLSVLLAGLLHDLDDPKLVDPIHSKNYTNTKKLLNQVLEHSWNKDNIIDLILQMISYVSTSSNGNVIPEPAKTKPWLLIPRYADRLEALGSIGLIRCWQFTKYVNKPYFTENTPRPTTKDEIKLYATSERFARYRGKSESLMDHVYDKLLHIGFRSGNRYLDSQVDARMDIMYDICLYFGRTGNITDEYFENLKA